MKILFITNDASGTGAPILILGLAEWLRKNASVTCGFILLHDGDLIDRFRENGYVKIINRSGTGIWNFLYRLIKQFVPAVIKWRERRKILNAGNKFRANLIYCNTAPAILFAPLLKKQYRVPIIGHVHELVYSVRKYAGVNALRLSLPAADALIACSAPVKEMLVHDYGIPEAGIHVIPPHVSIGEGSVGRRELLDELNIDPGVFVVTGSGRMDWIKGADLFLYTAYALSEMAPGRFVFIWIGGSDKEWMERYLAEVNILGLNSCVFFAGFRRNASTLIAGSDLFLLSSREESFGMVGLEAAMGGIPVVCFNTTHAFADFLSPHSELVIPYPDTRQAAERIFSLMNDADRRKKLGSALRDAALRYHTISQTGPEVLSVIRKILPQNGSF